MGNSSVRTPNLKAVYQKEHRHITRSILSALRLINCDETKFAILLPYRFFVTSGALLGQA
jgi:hypothetical protein